jgi:hypothetical protein
MDDYKVIRFASVSKFFNNLVFQGITNLRLICHYNYINNYFYRKLNFDDQMIQKFVNLRELNHLEIRAKSTISINIMILLLHLKESWK